MDDWEAGPVLQQDEVAHRQAIDESPAGVTYDGGDEGESHGGSAREIGRPGDEGDLGPPATGREGGHDDGVPPDLLPEIDLGGVRRSTIRRHQASVDEEIHADDGVAGRNPRLDDNPLDSDQVRLARLRQDDREAAVVAAALGCARTAGWTRARGGLGPPQEGAEAEEKRREGDEPRDQHEATSVEDHATTPDGPRTSGKEKIEARRDGVK